VTDTVVFIPAWNEEANLPAVLDDLRRARPEARVLVVDDGSTDRTADVSREHGADVLSLGTNRGLPVGIAAGYRWALEHDYEYCGRVDADGQHPAAELARLLALVRAGSCDVAVGSRFVSGDGYKPYRYRPDPTRRFGTAVLRRAMAFVLRRPFGDATSGLYAVNAKALPLLAEPFTSEAPEVEALIRIVDAGLRLEEVPVNMAARAGGESKLRGSRAVRVVLTVAGTLVAAKLIQNRRRRAA
jgi:glycosyltransferase involved in cell wall biosynthesis